MILQTLNRYYEDLARADKIARPGWAKAKISYALCINERGELEQVVPLLTDTGGKKPSPREFDLPAPVRKSSGIASQFLWENSSYLLGVDNKGNPKRSADCFQACGRFYHQLLDGVNSTNAKAILRFFDAWIPAQASEHPALQGKLEAVAAGANLIFRVNGAFPHEDVEIQEAWRNYYGVEEGEKRQCLITGRQDVIAAVHPSIKGVQGAQSSGAALVSFNAPAFCSYGKEQNFNAPVGKSAAFAYTAALNYLIADREHVQRIGDTTVVCWAEGAEPQYQGFSMAVLFGGPPPEGFTDNELYGAVERLAKGQPCEEWNLDPNRTFYILGLSPNNARLSVRFFYRNTFGRLMKNINRHYEDIKITHSGNSQFEHIPLLALLRTTVRAPSPEQKWPSPSPVMAGAAARAVFTGEPYPASLLQNAVLRIRAENKVTWERAAIIRAYYTRLNRRLKQRGLAVLVQEEAMGEKLDKSCAYLPYVLGELFAVMEKIQEDSAGGQGKLNRTIKDSYFTTAGATPNGIFSKLFPLSEYHMKKLKRDKPQFAYYLDAEKSELVQKITTPIPARMTEDEINCFYIGYYHRREEFYHKKEDS